MASDSRDFALAEFLDLTYPFPFGFKNAWQKYRLGVALEDRYILATGVYSGAFRRNSVARYLQYHEAQLQRALERAAAHEDLERLPAPLATDELLSRAEGVVTMSSVDLHRLRARERSMYPNLREFYMALLFYPDAEWDKWTQAAREELSEDKPYFRSPLFSIYDAVVLAADLLSDVMRLTEYQESSLAEDPWGISRRLEPHGGRFYALRLPKKEREGPQFVREAMQAKPDWATGVLEDVLMLKLLSYVRLPDDQPEPEVTTARYAISQSVGPNETGKLVNRLDWRLSWGVPLWRLTPDDRRSLKRAEEAAVLVRAALSRLVERQGELRLREAD